MCFEPNRIGPGRMDRTTGRRKYRMFRTGDAIGAFFFGSTCPLCGKLLYRRADAKRGICTSCAVRIPLICEPFCMKCGKPLTNEQEELCTDCRKRRHYYTRHRAALSYRKDVRISLYRFKYGNQRSFARFYARLLSARMGESIRAWRISCIVPVPLHRDRYKKRGYNQAGILAERIGAELGIPVDEQLLVRIRHSAPMKELTAAERLRNLEHVFAVNGPLPPDSRILLVDDIYTTGATVDAAAKALLQAGCSAVYAVSVAIGG